MASPHVPSAAFAHGVIALAATLCSLIGTPLRAQTGELGLTGDYLRWSSVLPSEEGADRITFGPQVGFGINATIWSEPMIGFRLNGLYAQTALVRTSEPVFGTGHSGLALDPDVRLVSGSADLLLRPFGFEGKRLLFLPLSPYFALGGGLVWVDPTMGAGCAGAHPGACGTVITAGGGDHLLERRLVPTVLGAVGVQIQLHSLFGIKLEAGSRLMRSPMRELVTNDDGSRRAGPRVDRFVHGPFARVGLRLFGGGERPTSSPPEPRLPVAVAVAAEVEQDSARLPADTVTRITEAAPAAAVRDTFVSLGEVAAVIDSASPLLTGVRPVAGVMPVDSVQPRAPGNDGIYDVVLDVPNVSVEEITLEVNNLHAHVSLDAKVAKLVSLNVGADVGIERVYLGIRGVQAEAHLKVDLDNVTTIVDRVLTTIDRNPEIISGLLQTLETTVTTVGDVANTALQPGGVVSQAVTTVGDVANTALQPGGVVSQTVETVGDVANTTLQPGGVASELVGAVGNTLENVTGSGGLLSTEGVDALGRTLTRTVDGTGRILSQTLDQTGQLVAERVVGSVLQLPVLQQTSLPSGSLVRTVQDVSGALIEVTLSAANDVLGTRVLRQGVGPGPAPLPPALAPATGPRAAPPRMRPEPQPQVRAPDAEPRQASGSGSGGNALAGTVEQTSRLLLVAMGVNDQGRVMQRLVQPTGELIMRVIDPATSQVLSTTPLGNVSELPLVRETTDSVGNIVREVLDSSGGLLELTITPTGILRRMRTLKLGVAAAASTPAVAVPSAAPSAAPEAVPVPGSAPIIPVPDDSTPALLLAQYVNAQGRVVQRFIASDGDISERALNAAGQLIVRKRAANARRLPVLREYVATTGDFVRLVQDPTGAVVELTFGAEGDLSQVRVLRGGGAPSSASASTGRRSTARPVHGATPAAAPVVAVLGEGFNAAGQLVQRVIEPTGRILERALDASGDVLQTIDVGSVLQLAVLTRIPQADGNLLLIAQDITGTLLEVLFDATGRVTNVRRVDGTAG